MFIYPSNLATKAKVLTIVYLVPIACIAAPKTPRSFPARIAVAAPRPVGNMVR